MTDTKRVYRWITVVTIALVLIQAILAGRGWFRDFDLLKTHGDIGSVTWLVVIAQLVLAYLNRQTLGRIPLYLGIALVVLVSAQLGLGYSGRDSANAAAWHVPNGVLIFGLASVAFGLAWLPAQTGSATPADGNDHL